MKINTLIIGVLGIFMIGCVSQKKFDALSSQKSRLDKENATLKEDLTIANSKIDRLNKQVDELVRDSIDLSRRLHDRTNAYKALQKKHDQLQTYYDNLVANSGKLNQNLAEKQEQLMQLEENLESSKRRNEELEINLREREEKVRELEGILAEKERAVNELKKLVSNALLNFKENDLTVEIKNGKVYVSLAEQLLFKSGSIVVDPKGVAAIKKLAEAIRSSEDIRIMVEGHTDNVPVSKVSQYMKDNWDLSVMRATSIVKILTDAGVDPQQITAAGRGEFAPITSNDLPEGRQINRRTEIILTPKLDELFQVLQMN